MAADFYQIMHHNDTHNFFETGTFVRTYEEGLEILKADAPIRAKKYSYWRMTLEPRYFGKSHASQVVAEQILTRRNGNQYVDVVEHEEKEIANAAV